MTVKAFRGCLWDGDSGHAGWVNADSVFMGETKVDVLQSELGFCLCGCPEDNLAYIKRGLKLLDIEKRDPEWKARFEVARNTHNPDHLAVWSGYCAAVRKLEDEHFGNRAAAYFFRYWADKADLTEHGGGVGSSWLTGTGTQLIDDIAEALSEAEAAET